MRDLFVRQLELVWSFATQFALNGVDADLARWETSGNVVTVHRADDGWAADWPDEAHSLLPDATIGWLLWHIEFWWNNAADAAEGRSTRTPDRVRWSGSTAGVIAAHDRWLKILNTHDLDTIVTGLMPEPRPLSFVALWVNFELTKNLAEINQLKIQHDNRQRSPRAESAAFPDVRGSRLPLPPPPNAPTTVTQRMTGEPAWIRR